MRDPEEEKRGNGKRFVNRKKERHVENDLENSYAFAYEFIDTQTHENAHARLHKYNNHKAKIGAHFKNREDEIFQCKTSRKHTRRDTHTQALSTVEKRTRKRKRNTTERNSRNDMLTVFRIMLLIKFVTIRISTNHFLHMRI